MERSHSKYRLKLVGLWQGLFHVLVTWKPCQIVVSRYNFGLGLGGQEAWLGSSPISVTNQKGAFDDPLQLTALG